MSDLRRKALAGAAQSRAPVSTLPSRPSNLRQSTIAEDVGPSGFEIFEDEGSENEGGGASVRANNLVPKSSSSRAPSSVMPSSRVPYSSSSSRAPKSVAPPSDAPSSATPSVGLSNLKFRDPSMAPSSKAPSSKVPSSMAPSSTPSMALTNSKFRDASKVPGSMVPSSSREKSRIASQAPTDDDEAPGIDEPSSAPPPSASEVPLPASVAPSAVPASAFSQKSRVASQAPRSAALLVSRAPASKVPSKMPSVIPSEKTASKVPTSKAPGSLAMSSKAPSVIPSVKELSKVLASKAPRSQAPSSRAPSVMPSMRDATKVPGSKLPSEMPSMRDRTKAPEDIPIPTSVPISFSEEKWSQIEKSRTSRALMRSIFTNPGDEEIASKIATVAPTGAQEEQFQEMMQQLGSCMDKYTWVRREDIGGYLCKGGKHFTSFELIAEGKGGWHVLLEAFKFEKGLNPHGPFYGYPVWPSKAWATNKIDKTTGKKGAFFSLDRKASDGPVPENIPE